MAEVPAYPPPGFARGGDQGPIAVDYTDEGVPHLQSPFVHKRGVYWSIVYATANGFRDERSTESDEFFECLNYTDMGKPVQPLYLAERSVASSAGPSLFLVSSS